MASPKKRSFGYSREEMAEKHNFAAKLGYTDFYEQCDCIDAVQGIAYNNGIFVGQAVQLVKMGTGHDWSDLPKDQIDAACTILKNNSRGAFGDPEMKEVTEEQQVKFTRIMRMACAVYTHDKYETFWKWFEKQWNKNFGEQLDKFLDKCISELGAFPVVRQNFIAGNL